MIVFISVSELTGLTVGELRTLLKKFPPHAELRVIKKGKK